MVEQDGAPADEHAGGGEVDEPVEHDESTAGQAHEREKHEGGLDADADVRHTPGRRSQQHRRRLPLQCQRVQPPRARQQRLVSRRPGRGQHHGVDDVWDGGNAGGARSDDKGRLRGGTGLVIETRVVARHQHADHEHSEDVEEGDAEENALAGPRNHLTRVARLGSRHSDGLRTGEREHGGAHDGPVAQEAAPGAVGDVLYERAGNAPVMEAEARHPGNAPKTNNKSQYNEEDDEEYLEQREPELNLPINAHERDTNEKGEGDRQTDPERRVYVGPELEEHADGGDLCWDREPVSVDLDSKK